MKLEPLSWLSNRVWALILTLSSLCCKEKTDSCMTMHSALLLYHSQTAQMLESCWNWLDPGLGLIKLANPAAGTGFQGQEWRGHKLEVTRTLLGGARAWHNSDGKWFVRFREGAECVGHSCTLGRWKMKQLQRRRGSAFDPAVEQVATRDRWLPATPSFSSWTSMREACWMSSCTGAFCFLPACSARWP